MEKNLYDTLREKEQEIEEIDNSVKYLVQKGFHIGGFVPDMTDEAYILINRTEEFRDNHILQRMRVGERLEDLIKDIVSQRKFNLRFNKEERDRFNARVKDLERILPMGDWLRAFPFYNLTNPETATLFGGSISAALGSLIGYLMAGEEAIPYSAGAGALIGCLVGGLMGGIFSSFRKRLTKDLFQEEVSFINKSLGRRN